MGTIDPLTGLACAAVLLVLAVVLVRDSRKHRGYFWHRGPWGQGDYWTPDYKSRMNEQYWQSGGYVWVDRFHRWLPDIQRCDVRHLGYWTERGYGWSMKRHRWIRGNVDQSGVQLRMQKAEFQAAAKALRSGPK